MRTPPLVLALAAALAVTACGDTADDAADTASTSTSSSITSTTGATAAGGTSDPTTTTAAPATTAATTTSPTTTDVTTTTQATTTTATTTTVAPDDGACLVGTWVVSEEQMNVFYDALEAEMDVPAELGVVGQAVLELGPDTYEWRPEFVLELTVAGTTGTGDASGSITGEYVTADGVITTMSEVNQLELVVEVGGQTIDGSDLGNEMLNSAPINDAPYECVDGSVTIWFTTADGSVPIALSLA
ncbi:MAG: hypothetical protein WD225_07325 [Ilumatobacteraceae bacterium]